MEINIEVEGAVTSSFFVNKVSFNMQTDFYFIFRRRFLKESFSEWVDVDCSRVVASRQISIKNRTTAQLIVIVKRDDII